MHKPFNHPIGIENTTNENHRLDHLRVAFIDRLHQDATKGKRDKVSLIYFFMKQHFLHIRYNNVKIVFIHGAGGSIQTWKYQFDAFKVDFNVLAIDLRDHGSSKHIQPAYNKY
ncbi:MAG: alpha/beta hydrolase, partial [Bacteroidota bacterium]